MIWNNLTLFSEFETEHIQLFEALGKTMLPILFSELGQVFQSLNQISGVQDKLTKFNLIYHLNPFWRFRNGELSGPPVSR